MQNPSFFLSYYNESTKRVGFLATEADFACGRAECASPRRAEHRDAHAARRAEHRDATNDTARQLASLRQQSEESHHRVRTLEQQNARECLFYKQSSRELKRRLKELSEVRTGVDSNAFLPEPPTSHSHPAPRSAPSSSVSAPPLHCSVPRPRRN